MTKLEIIEIFKRHDLDDYSRWSVGNGIQHVLSPLSLDQDLKMLKIKGEDNTRVNFRLFEFNGLLFFHEIDSEIKYGFDISDIDQDKIYFRVRESQGVVWTRLSTALTDDLLSYFL